MVLCSAVRKRQVRPIPGRPGASAIAHIDRALTHVVRVEHRERKVVVVPAQAQLRALGASKRRKSPRDVVVLGQWLRPKPIVRHILALEAQRRHGAVERDIGVRLIRVSLYQVDGVPGHGGHRAAARSGRTVARRHHRRSRRRARRWRRGRVAVVAVAARARKLLVHAKHLRRSVSRSQQQRSAESHNEQPVHRNTSLKERICCACPFFRDQTPRPRAKRISSSVAPNSGLTFSLSRRN